MLMVGSDARSQVVSDHPRAEERNRARKTWGKKAWEEEKDREKAVRVAQQVRRAATADGRTGRSVRGGVSVGCDHPLGLRDDRAELDNAEPSVPRPEHQRGRDQPVSRDGQQGLRQFRRRTQWSQGTIRHARHENRSRA